MAAPDYVPVAAADRVRAAERLPPPDAWTAVRPGEIPGLRPPGGPMVGTPGPDQGYGLKLARQLAAKLQLGEHERVEDAIAGCLGVALRRAALFGRAPVIYDFELAYRLFGFFGDAPPELVAFRRELFEEAAHDYFHQRAIVDRVPEETLRLAPAEVAERLSEWKSLLETS